MQALVLGVNGATGRAIAADLVTAGWSVRGTGRDQTRFPVPLATAGVEFVRADRYDTDDLTSVFRQEVDLVVDCVAYTAEHARQLVRHRDRFGTAVVLSSKAVYVDGEGRHSNSDGPPVFDGPVGESQATMAPDFSGDFNSRAGYGSNKVAMEQTLLNADVPVSILRASRIHGAGAGLPREWFVVRRVLDGRTRIPAAHGGRTGNHPTAAVNLARLVTTCAAHPGRRVLNAADPGQPTAADIIRAIGTACRREIDVVGLPEGSDPELGWTPWDTWPPFFLDTTAAAALGYQPVGSYADTVADEVAELLALPPERRAALNEEPYFDTRFDYRRDDEALTVAGEHSDRDG